MKILLLLSIYSMIWCQTEVGYANTLDIMTWNLQDFPKQDATTVVYVDNLIRSSNLDIIALQEITSTSAFIQLIDIMNDSDSLNQWMGFRADGYYGQLAYVINTSSVTIINNPYSILDGFEHYFAWRNPYVVKISYMNDEFIIINNHFKCCGDNIIQYDHYDEEYRRQKASIYLKNYIDTYLSDENVIVLGDFNDELTDSEVNNVFWNFLSDPDEYLFVDMEIAQGSPNYFSYPTWPSHIDHILITNELFNYVSEIQTVLIDHNDLNNDGDIDYEDWETYDDYISDHRPVHISLCATECDMGIEDDTKIFNPEDFIILNAYPNPFNPSTNVMVNIPLDGQVYIHIFNIAGQVVARLGGDYLTPGTYQYIWHANNLPSGIYIVRAELNNKISMLKKIIKIN